MHELLEEQIRRHLRGDSRRVPAAFLEAVDRSYRRAEAERRELRERLEANAEAASRSPSPGGTTSETRGHQSQKMEAVGRLAGGIAHDFNNLLTVIKGYCDLCRRILAEDHPGEEGSRLARNVHEITKAAQRAADMTGRLLAFSRQQELEPEILDLDEAIEDFRPILRRLIDEDVGLRFRLEASPAHVRADLGRVQQVLLNLAINARDAMPRGGVLTIRTEARQLDGEEWLGEPALEPGRGDHVLLRVRDTGDGISEEARSRLFEPFFTTKAKGEGTGLGLATVYGIVRQSGGGILVRSEPGEGAEFIVALPRVEPSVAARTLSGAHAPLDSRPARVLVVEDEEPVREMIEALLVEQGHEVLVVADPVEAVEIYGAASAPDFDLLVTDIVMPGMLGTELARALRQARGDDLPVLFISGYDPSARQRRGAPVAGGVFLQKPFDAETLERKIREALETRDASDGAGSGGS